ncbi:MAG: geranylgeranylglyceryl/heptaprenylglyceryl phosphate synthase [Bacteroidales bacterium]|nr:geranylgeranylglyceryl/heptaprenylglyceryl phosphate synthase [Bacteroidales bacterium]MDD3892045.1 geranylgeranylglyceryl/heptaprenylglyceryl phosphate synthase [Bacteroidales bacterium]
MIYSQLLKSQKGLFALLVDPDKYSFHELKGLSQRAQKASVDIILLGGSLTSASIEQTLMTIRQHSSIPIVLFPGNALQFSPSADAILLLSLISGRNPDFLIGNHVLVSQALHESGMEVIPTGYILIESGAVTSVQYMSNTLPIPRNKSDIVVATAIAGQQLGLKSIYLEAGSGADLPVPKEIICEVRKSVDLPIIVGGGLRTPDAVRGAREAGANMIVVGNVLEKDAGLLSELVGASR